MCFNHGYTPPPNPNPQNYGYPNNILTSPSSSLCFNHGYTPHTPNPYPSSAGCFEPYSSQPQSQPIDYSLYHCNNYPDFPSYPYPSYTTSNPYGYTNDYPTYNNNQQQAHIDTSKITECLQKSRGEFENISKKFREEQTQASLVLKASLQKLSESFQTLREKFHQKFLLDSQKKIEEGKEEIEFISFPERHLSVKMVEETKTDSTDPSLKPPLLEFESKKMDLHMFSLLNLKPPSSNPFLQPPSRLPNLLKAQASQSMAPPPPPPKPPDRVLDLFSTLQPCSLPPAPPHLSKPLFPCSPLRPSPESPNQYLQRANMSPNITLPPPPPEPPDFISPPEKVLASPPEPELPPEPPNLVPSIVSQLSQFRARSLTVGVVVFDPGGMLAVASFSVIYHCSVIDHIKSFLGFLRFWHHPSFLSQIERVKLTVSTVRLESYCTSASWTFKAAHYCATSPAYHLLTRGLTFVHIIFHAPSFFSSIGGDTFAMLVVTPLPSNKPTTQQNRCELY